MRRSPADIAVSDGTKQALKFLSKAWHCPVCADKHSPPSQSILELGGHNPLSLYHRILEEWRPISMAQDRINDRHNRIVQRRIPWQRFITLAYQGIKFRKWKAMSYVSTAAPRTGGSRAS